MKTLRARCLLIAIACILHAPCPASAAGLESRLLGPSILTARPRDVLTVLVELQNTTQAAMDCVAEAKLPPGWVLVTSQGPLRIDANGTCVALVSFAVASHAPAGSYEVVLALKPIREPSLATRHVLTVNVPRSGSISLRLVDVPQSVLAGSSYEAVYLVTNEGNDLRRIRIKVTSTPGFHAVPDVTEIELGPGDSRRIDVSVKTPPDVNETLTHRLGVGAATTGGDPPLYAEASSSVVVIPVGARPLGDLRTIPASLRLRQGWQSPTESAPSFQAELEAAGPVDEEGETRLEIIARGPDTLDRTTYGTRDQYTLEVSSPAYSLTLGDSQFSLSPLTEQYLNARGFSGILRNKGFALQGFTASPRRVEPDTTVKAAGVVWGILEGLELRINGLEKDVEEKDASRLASIQMNISPLSGLDIELEGGRGKKEGDTGDAFMARASYFAPSMTLNLSHIDAGYDYPGYYTDRRITNAHASIPLTDTLQLQTTLDRDVSNIDRDPRRGNAPSDIRARIGVEHRPDRSTTYSLSTVIRRLKDPLSPSPCSYTETGVRMGALKNVGMVSLNLFGEAGTREDTITHHRSTPVQITWSGYYRYDTEGTCGAYLRYARMADLDKTDATALTAGITASRRFPRGTRIQAGIQADASTSTPSKDRYLISTSLAQPLGRYGTVEIQALRTELTSSAEDETSVLVEYTYEFGLPVWKKKGVCTLAGVARDASTGMPIKGLILRLDTVSCATGADGRFIFTPSRPGSMYLVIDMSGLSPDLIPDCRNPLPLSIGAGEQKSIEITITKKASITGRIDLYGAFVDGEPVPFTLEAPQRPGAREEIRKVSGLPRVLVELRREDQTLRVFTDKDGRFAFSDLRPGAWKLFVPEEYIPAYHRIDANNIGIDLLPGESRQVEIKVVPRKRAIKFIQEGGVILQGQ